MVDLVLQSRQIQERCLLIEDLLSRANRSEYHTKVSVRPVEEAQVDWP